jgi:hypothetical protein
MPKIDVNELRLRFDIVADIKDERLSPHIEDAERELRIWVSDAKYDATLPAKQVSALKFAEANLAVYYLLLSTGVRIRRSGLVKREQDAGGSVTNNVNNEFYDVDDIITLRKEFYNAAFNAAKPYETAAVAKPKISAMLVKGGWAK